jgi:hypothetical protein
LWAARSVQLSLLLAVVLALFLLTGDGLHARLGLYHEYLRRHRSGLGDQGLGFWYQGLESRV